jgi:hypothetical protein
VFASAASLSTPPNLTCCLGLVCARARLTYTPIPGTRARTTMRTGRALRRLEESSPTGVQVRFCCARTRTAVDSPRDIQVVCSTLAGMSVPAGVALRVELFLVGHSLLDPHWVGRVIAGSATNRGIDGREAGDVSWASSPWCKSIIQRLFSRYFAPQTSVGRSAYRLPPCVVT